MNIDLQAFIERMILFDHYLLSSVRLKEFPDLVNVFGYGPTMDLLNSGRLQIYSDSVTTAAIGRKRSWFTNGKEPDLPLGSFSFSILRNANHRGAISEGMSELESRSHLGGKSLIKMKRAIGDCLLPWVEQEGAPSMRQFNTDMSTNHPVVTNTLAATLAGHFKKPVDPNDIELRMFKVADAGIAGTTGDFQTESNLETKFGLSREKAHELLELALLGATGLSRRFEYMDRYQAWTPIQASEASLIDVRMAVMVKQWNPDSVVEQFRRITTLTGFPELGNAAETEQVSLEQVMKISQSDECRDFREWLRGSAAATDIEIQDAFGSIRAKLAGLAVGVPGKTVRWITSTGIGMVPGLGNALGAAAGFVDTFLVEKILPKPGPIMFLKTHYDSIFKP